MSSHLIEHIQWDERGFARLAKASQARETSVSLRLYLDEHIHAAITQGLRTAGVDVLTVQEDGMSGISDPRRIATLL